MAMAHPSTFAISIASLANSPHRLSLLFVLAYKSSCCFK